MVEAYTKIRNGRLDLGDYTIREWLSSNEGRDVRVSVEVVKNRRSAHQNSYYWSVVLPVLADETGHTSTEIHQILKDRFLGGRSTKTLTVAEYETYLDQVRRFASADLGCYIPAPNEPPIDIE